MLQFNEKELNELKRMGGAHIGHEQVTIMGNMIVFGDSQNGVTLYVDNSNVSVYSSIARKTPRELLHIARLAAKTQQLISLKGDTVEEID